MIAESIRRYEARQQGVIAYHRKADGMDSGISTLRLLINNHGLTISDFEKEIGKKALVSMIPTRRSRNQTGKTLNRE